MAVYTVTGPSQVGSALTQILNAEDIVPGSDPSYEICKLLRVYHTLGEKIVSKPIELAQSQEREITVTDSPGDRAAEAFKAQWGADGIDDIIREAMATARCYGISSVGIIEPDGDPTKPINFQDLYKKDIAYNVWDPLNTAGSLVLNQNPNAPDFLKTTSIRVSGQEYHKSRTCVVMNGQPIYIQYTNSAFGFVGRSAFQASLFPLKSFIQSMMTDDLVTLKAGVIVAKLKPQGSIVDNLMAFFRGQSQQVIKQAQNYNVISINAPDEDITSLNLQYVADASKNARDNILKNIAAGDGMPAQILNDETYVEGFGEGTEDAKKVARYVDRIRLQMGQLYKFFDNVIQYRAWNPDWYKALQNDIPSWKSVSYEEAFVRFRNSFKAVWPSFIVEPPSEAVKIEDVKLRAVIAIVEVIGPALDPVNRAALYQWATDCFSENKLLFPSPLNLDFSEDSDFFAYAEQQDASGAEQMMDAPKNRPFAATDAVAMLRDAVTKLPGADRQRVTKLLNVVNGK